MIKNILIAIILFLNVSFAKAQWTELGGSSVGLNVFPYISSICLDSTGNIYATGFFTNADGDYYVTKWNGTYWQELESTDTFKLNEFISSICSDGLGNIYTAGGHYNSTNENVAKWNGISWSQLGIGSKALNASLAGADS